MSQNRLDWVDTAKAISIILVVVVHIRDQFEQFSLQSAQLDFFTEVSANLRMPMFFAVAGLFASKWLTKSWRELAQGKLALLVWVFLIWQPVVLAYRLLNHWVLEGPSWQFVVEQVLRLGASPLRPNGELWFLWTLALFFVLARLTAKFHAKAQVLAAAAISFIWMSLVEPALPEFVFDAIGSGWHGIFRYYFLFIGFALFSKHIRAAVSRLKWHTSALLFCVWLGEALIAAYYAIPPGVSLFILSLLGVVGGIGLANLLGKLALLRYLGGQTLPIYLGHSAIIAIFLSEITAFELTPALTTNLYLAVLVLTCLVIACSLGLSKLKPLAYMYQRPAFPSERAVPAPKQKSVA
ncbi:acyltransferase family protein [Enteractinococcus coprophilus]|uniref:Putative membrane protein YcfT n=1 Tax=Enteractinococcus coprophilus TaxID=1027633 RepID=A0A543AGF2_9MICC|nr:acyltransferase family protein [Enteractinococcus coprophilus]TQL71659.1 putative membrane protein YcfT [Enteractinococcus coprophilus]